MPSSILSWAVIAALLVLAPWHSALACMCGERSVTGFVHPDVMVLPANAKGVLFHWVAKEPLTVASFSITSSLAGAATAARLEPIQLSDAHPM